MLGVFFEGVLRVIYRSLYVGLSVIGHNFEEAIFLTSTSKSRVITAGFTIFPSFVASGAKIPYVECTKYVRITLPPFSDTQLTQENHGQS